MRRSLLSVSRCSRRTLATTATTAAEVPDDPDILTTQDPSFNPTDLQHTEPHIAEQHGTEINLSQKYPRLQYRSPPRGVNPAFDLALELIKQDRRETAKKIAQMDYRIKKFERFSDEKAAKQLSDMRIYRRELVGLLDKNDPEIRWRFARGDVDLSMPIYRHLAQRKWAERQLHLIQQRTTQMYVVPDVLPPFTPTVDVRLLFPDRNYGLRKGQFEVGEMLHSRDTVTQPAIEIQSFGDDGAKYSIAIIDPDVPDEANDTFTSYLHYLHTDISLFPTHHAVSAENGTIVHNYIPPHPQKGTPYHRYTVVVWQQPESPHEGGKKQVLRAGFDAQMYAEENGLHPQGISFWRQVWDDNVAEVMSKFPSVRYVEKNFRRIKA